MTNGDVKRFLIEVNIQRRMYHDKNFPTLEFHPVYIALPKRHAGKYIKLLCNRSVWGFIAKQDVITSTKSFRKGDLLKAASASAPAKHSRGNIVEGTATYGPHGPDYLK